ncbi:RNA-directed DNA methylation 4 isoform X1 [Canna indica]|uniref:RNA-directed DNA methylation 4 isoform X1 n=1 Tax=Canna indica TaxID=4628 RepID=A0AAQ3JUQ1_9LILI|nr:RNA-directed DNA methylation 4 isoform X1 [Canna indica]
MASIASWLVTTIRKGLLHGLLHWGICIASGPLPIDNYKCLLSSIESLRCQAEGKSGLDVCPDVTHHINVPFYDYVYDLYTVGDCLDANMEDVADYPPVQVNDDENEYYDGSLQSEYDSDDSNDNPRNDCPDEESSGVEDENEDPFGDSEGSNSEYEHEEVDIDEDDENWRWRYR